MVDLWYDEAERKVSRIEMRNDGRCASELQFQLIFY